MEPRFKPGDLVAHKVFLSSPRGQIIRIISSPSWNYTFKSWDYLSSLMIQTNEGIFTDFGTASWFHEEESYVLVDVNENGEMYIYKTGLS